MPIVRYKHDGVNKSVSYNFFIFLLIIIYKIALEYSYVVYLGRNVEWYPVDIDPIKYIYSLLWIVILYISMPRDKEKVSTFFLEFFLIFQIVPLSAVYAMKNESTIYFTCVCCATMLSQFIICKVRPIKISPISLKINWWIVGSCILLVSFLINVYQKNGLPTTIALDIYDVYKLRSSGIYSLSKYEGYIQTTIVKVVIPFLLTKFIIDKKWISIVFVFLCEGIIYLYAGQKSIFFTGIMVIGGVIWSLRKNFTREFWPVFMTGIIVSCFGVSNRLFELIYSLLVRRIMIVPAYNKFCYYDFFLRNPKEGLAGIFPRWIFNISSNYGTGKEHFSYLIAKEYYNRPEMQANTGFLAEGYFRWGILGVFLILIIFTIIIQLLDNLQKRTTYSFALGVGLPFVFGLADGHLISTIILGYNMVWLLIVMFYKNPCVLHFTKNRKIEKKDRLCVELQE